MYTKDHLNSAKMDLTENSRIVLEKRYLRKNSDGEIIETPEKMFERVASAIAEPENLYGDTGDFSYWQGRFYEIMHTLEFVPNSPRSEEHTSELQSLVNLVCRLLLEKKKKEEK